MDIKLLFDKPIFKLFAAYFTTNLDLDSGKKYFASRQIDKINPQKFILKSQFKQSKKNLKLSRNASRYHLAFIYHLGQK